MSAPVAVAAAAGLLVAAAATGVVLHQHAGGTSSAGSSADAGGSVVAAGRRLAAVALPPRTQRCADDATASAGYVCWRGAVEPQVTAGYLLQGLRDVGAAGVRGTCVTQAVLGPMCEVQATVGSRPFRAVITRPPAQDGHGTAPGSDLAGDVLSAPRSLPPGQPLAIPLPPG